MDLLEKDHKSILEFIFNDVLISGRCVATMINITVSKNFMTSIALHWQLSQTVKGRNPISCQFLIKDLGSSPQKNLSRVELSLTKVGGNLICKENIVVLMFRRIEQVLLIEFLKWSSIN